METNFLTSRGVTFVIWISIELTFISFMLRPWRFTGKVFEVMYCVIIKQWISNDVCLFTSWNPTYPPPHDSLGLHNRRKQNAFSSSCFRHHLFSPSRHLRLISWSFLPSLPKVKMIPNVKKIPMREAPDLFIACNKSRMGRAKLIRTKYRSGKIHFFPFSQIQSLFHGQDIVSRSSFVFLSFRVLFFFFTLSSLS